LPHVAGNGVPGHFVTFPPRRKGVLLTRQPGIWSMPACQEAPAACPRGKGGPPMKTQRLLLTAALLSGACTAPAPVDDGPDDTIPPNIHPTVPENGSTCAPSPVRSTTSGSKTYYRYA